MSSSTMQLGVQYLRRLLAASGRQNESDEQLLDAFTTRHDDSAFAVLVHRHGPMVLHVCRRVLNHEQDAEDAFQATFLVLAQSAAALRNKTSLAGFLHRVAQRTAVKAKYSAAQRRKHEGSLGALTQSRSPADPANEISWREVRSLLDEEIARLPVKYRTAFVLCCLEDLSQAEAARRLGLKPRTLSSRLSTARKRLSQRLSRRGLELTAVLAASTLAAQTATALPAGLMASTIEAVLTTTAGEKITGIVSAVVSELVRSMTAAMMASKIKLPTMVILAVCLLTAATSGALVNWYGRTSEPLAATPPPASKIEDKSKTASPQPKPVDSVEIQGRVFGPDGRPQAGAKLLLLGEHKKIVPLGVSAADGRFSIAVPKPKKTDPLIAQKDDAGIDFIPFGEWKPGKPIEFRLVKDNAIRGRIVTTEGKPVRGVRVWVTSIDIYKSLDVFLAAWKKRDDWQFRTPGHIKSLWIESAALFAATTDGDGRFVLHGIGAERTAMLRISGPGIADAEADEVVNRPGFDAKPYNRWTLDNIPKERRFPSREMLSGPEVSIVAEAEKPIRGVVKEAGTGKGRANVVVRLTRTTWLDLLPTQLQAKTDADGHYEIRGARKAKSYILEVRSDPAAGYVASYVQAADTPGYQPVLADITVKKGVIVTGKVIDRATGRSVRGFAEVAALVNNPFAKEYPQFNPSGFWSDNGDTGTDGSFRIVTIPGPVLLMGGLSRSGDNFSEWIKRKPPIVDEKYPHYFLKTPEHVQYYGLGGGITPVQGHFCKVLDIKPGTDVVNQDIFVERASTLAMRIEDAEGRPLSGVWASGFTPENIFPPRQLEGTSGTVYGLEARKPRLLVCYEPERKLVCARTLKGDEMPPIVVKLGAPGAIKARLLDADGKPLAGIVVDVQYRDREAWETHRVINEGKQSVSDAHGDFAFETVIPELKWELSFHHGKRKFERETKSAAETIQLKPGERRDLGAINVKPARE